MGNVDELIGEIDDAQTKKNGNGDKHYVRFALVFADDTEKGQILKNVLVGIKEKLGTTNPWDILKYVLKN